MNTMHIAKAISDLAYLCASDLARPVEIRHPNGKRVAVTGVSVRKLALKSEPVVVVETDALKQQITAQQLLVEIAQQLVFVDGKMPERVVLRSLDGGYVQFLSVSESTSMYPNIGLRANLDDAGL